MNENKWIIFDLDGTLADIEDRRQLCTKDNGKMDWDKFFNPENIKLDKPNWPVIKMAQALAETGHMIAIFSGRSKGTQLTTKSWLVKHKVPFHLLKMRPTENKWKFMPDEKLKLGWFEELFQNEIFGKEGAQVVCVFDDRQKVVDMWREIGLTCMQVAPGKF